MTEVNKELEDKLWSVSSENPLDKDSCNRLINYLLARLGDFLQTPLKLVGENRCREDSFSTTFRGTVTPTAYCISYVGTLGMQVIDKAYGISVSADLYLFTEGIRLYAGKKEKSYIYLEYIREDNSFGTWISQGWEEDEFEEYEDIDEEDYFYRNEED